MIGNDQERRGQVYRAGRGSDLIGNNRDFVTLPRQPYHRFHEIAAPRLISQDVRTIA